MIPRLGTITAGYPNGSSRNPAGEGGCERAEKDTRLRLWIFPSRISGRSTEVAWIVSAAVAATVDHPHARAPALHKKATLFTLPRGPCRGSAA